MRYFGMVWDGCAGVIQGYCVCCGGGVVKPHCINSNAKSSPKYTILTCRITAPSDCNHRVGFLYAFDIPRHRIWSNNTNKKRYKYIRYNYYNFSKNV